MRVKIEQNEDGDYYFLIPDDLREDLSWNKGDPIEWIDNGDGSCTLKKLSQLELLKLRAFEDPIVKAEYERLKDDSDLDL
ncbi:hypothetical protein NTH50_003801 [Vibrio mimicus]